MKNFLNITNVENSLKQFVIIRNIKTLGGFADMFEIKKPNVFRKLEKLKMEKLK